MKYISTRNTRKEYNFEEVFIKGLAEDGGLFVPKFLNKYNEEELKTLSVLSYQDLAKKIIFPFIEGFMSENELSDIVDKSYSVFRKVNVVNLIDAKNDNNILDVCSAPGGKASLLGQIMKNKMFSH